MTTLFRSVVLAVFLVIQPCGSNGGEKGASGTAGTPALEPATLLSREDARALTGVAFDECTVTEQPAVGLKLCVYDKNDAFLQVGLTQGKRGNNTPESIYASIKEAFKDAARIEGLGDDNFLAPPGLHIMQDGYYITVSLGLLNKDRDRLRTVAVKVLENLNRQTHRP